MTDELQPVPEPDHIADIGDALEALLEDSLTTPQRLAVSGALTTIYDVVPPYQPRLRTSRPTTPVGVQEVLDAMRRGIDAAKSVPETIRIGKAAQEVRTAFE